MTGVLDAVAIEQDFPAVAAVVERAGAGRSEEVVLDFVVVRVIEGVRCFCLVCDSASLAQGFLAEAEAPNPLDIPRTEALGDRRDSASVFRRTDVPVQGSYYLEEAVHTLDIVFLASNFLVANTEVVVGVDKTLLLGAGHLEERPFYTRVAYEVDPVDLAEEAGSDNSEVARCLEVYSETISERHLLEAAVDSIVVLRDFHYYSFVDLEAVGLVRKAVD